MVWEDKTIEYPLSMDRMTFKASNEVTPVGFIELMKILNCLELEEYTDMMDLGVFLPGFSSPGHAGHADMKRNMFEWLCHLDPENQRKVFEYAEKKCIWYKLKRSR